MPQVKVTLTVDIPEGAAAVFETLEPEPLQLDGADLNDTAVRWMEEHTPAPQQPLQRELLERLRSEFGLVGSPPSTGGRPYLNFHSDSRYGTSRVGALVLKTSRLYAVLDPALRADFPGAEPAEGRYLTLYVRERDDIELAVSLIRRALEVRGWTG